MSAISISFLMAGETAYGIKKRVLAHEDPPLLNKNANVFIISSDYKVNEFTVIVEKTEDGSFLVNGEKIPDFCTESCHSNE